MEIRTEIPADIPVIHQLTATAFAPKAFSDGTEPAIIDKLREDGDLTLSIVALKDGVLAGHVAFSPVSISSAKTGWFGLGPVSVLPELQRTGIGKAVIKEGLARLQKMNAQGCALIGDPNYYSKLGFISDGNLHYEGIPDHHVQWIGFSQEQPTGQLIIRPAFG